MAFPGGMGGMGGNRNQGMDAQQMQEQQMIKMVHTPPLPSTANLPPLLTPSSRCK